MSVDAQIERLRRRVEGLETGERRFADAFESNPHALLSLGHPDIDAHFTHGGLAPGSHQFAGREGDPAAARSFAIMLLARHLTERPAARALIVQDASAVREAGPLYGPGLHALGLDPGRLVLLETKEASQALRATNEVLRAGEAEILLVDLWAGAALADLSVTRRFNLAAEKARALVLITTPDLSATSAALTRWRIASSASFGIKHRLGAPTLSLELVRNRHGRTGRWTLEWNSHDRLFQSLRKESGNLIVRAPPAVATPLVSKTFDRSGSAQTAASVFTFGAHRQAG